LVVFSPLGDERFDCESTVGATSSVPKPTLYLMMVYVLRRFFEDF